MTERLYSKKRTPKPQNKHTEDTRLNKNKRETRTQQLFNLLTRTGTCNTAFGKQTAGKKTSRISEQRSSRKTWKLINWHQQKRGASQGHRRSTSSIQISLNHNPVSIQPHWLLLTAKSFPFIATDCPGSTWTITVIWK